LIYKMVAELSNVLLDRTRVKMQVACNMAGIPLLVNYNIDLRRFFLMFKPGRGATP